LLSIGLVGRSLAAGLADELPFDVYSNGGNEVMHGDCEPKAGSGDSEAICNFTDVRVLPPDPISDEDKLLVTETQYSQTPTTALRPQLEDELRRLIQKKEAVLQKQKKNDPNSVPLTESYLTDYRKSLAEVEKNPSRFAQDRKPNWQERSSYEVAALNARLKDPASGPKTKDLMKRMGFSWSAKDIASFEQLSNSRTSRTCHSYFATFSINFKRLSKYKWLSKVQPEGPCKVVRVYELAQDPSDHTSWTFTQRNIAVGTTVGLCSAFAEGESEAPVEVFSSKNNHWLELPCDWLDWSLNGLDTSWP
jgi:hypothetical protein